MSKRWWILAVLFLARTAMGFQFQSIGSLSPFLMEAMLLDFAMLGTLIGLFKLPGIVVALPGGWLGRRFGDKTMVAVGLLLMAVGGALVGASESYALALVGRSFCGAGAVLLNILLAKMLMDWFAGHEMVFAMSVLVNSWPFGIAIGLMTQGTMAVAFGWQAVLFATSAVALVSLVLIVAGYHAPPRAPDTPAPAVAKPGFGPGEFGAIALASGAWTLFNVGLLLVVSYGPAMLTAMGHGIEAAGLIVSLGTWLGIVTIPLGGWLAERWGRPYPVMVVLLGLAVLICAAMPGFAQPIWPFIAFGVLAWAPAGPIMALASEAVRPDNRAFGMGVFFTWYYLGTGVLIPAGGALRDATQAPAAPIYFAGVIFLASLTCVGAFRAHARARARALT
jgi:MFS family permease